MKIQLSEHFGYRKLLSFTLPSVATMAFISIYGVVDGFFVSNFVGKTPFSAVNFIMPLLMILGCTGFMFGAGGSALIAKTLGEGDQPQAQSLFSLFVYVTVGLGVLIAVAGFFLLRPIAAAMGAEGQLLDDSVVYGRIWLLTLPLLMLQYEFHSFFIMAERPQLGFWSSVAAGMTNMVLDFLFVAVLHWGLRGAAAATALSQAVGGLFPLCYFGFPNKSPFRLGRTAMDGRALMKACANGSSELMSNISMSLVSMLYNVQLLNFAGEDGVAAYGVLMYVNMIFLSAFIGYSSGVAPVISFHYGARNREELRSLLKKSALLISVSSLLMFLAAELLGRPLSILFTGYDEALLTLTTRAFLIYSLSFLFSGVAIFGSSFFTALNDGLTSALISFLRSLLFQVAAVLILPAIWGVDGIWASIVVAELVAAVVTLIFLAAKKKRFGY